VSFPLLDGHPERDYRPSEEGGQAGGLMSFNPKCLVLGHKYLRVRYPDSPDGYFLRCRRCSHERDEQVAASSRTSGIWGG
jgi:hypothetical protein